MNIPQQNSQAGRKTKHRTWILIVSILTVAAAGGIWLLRGDPEPDLPQEQKIKRHFSTALNPDESTVSRLNAIRKSMKAAGNIPADKRHPAIIEALAGTLTQSWDDFTKLKPEQKPARAAHLLADAEKTRKFYYSFSKKDRRKALSLLNNTPGGRAQINRAIDIAANKFSPEDRRLLGPVVKIWKSMLDDNP